MATTYRFTTMTSADLPMIRDWLRQPHVVEWWGDADEQYDLVRGDLDEPAMDQSIVAAGARPFAYLQSYRLTDWNIDFDPQPDGTRGIDQFIGCADMLDRGHGSALIRRFCDALLAEGVPRVVTDPDPTNARAIRAYEKAGFAKDRVVQAPDGPAILMVRDR